MSSYWAMQTSATLEREPSAPPATEASERRRDRDAPGSPINSEAAALALLLLAALAIRLTALGTVPGNVTADEADNLQVAYHVRVGTGPGFFGFDWKPQPLFSVWLMTQVMQVAGWTVFGMRLTSAVLSVVALVPFYLVARRQVSPLAALATTALLATNLWYLNFSRSGWENVHVALYALGAMYGLLRGLETLKWRYWILAGVFCALGLYGYFAGRVIVVAILAFLPFALLQRRAEWKRVLGGYAVMLAVCAGLFAPQLQSINQNRERFEGRTRAVYALRDARTVEQARDVLVSQVSLTVRSFLFFDQTVNVNSRYNAPGRGMLDRATAVLCWIGLLASLWRWRDTALWWLMLLGGIGAIQVLSSGTPDGARAVGFAPILYLFAALGLQTLVAGLERFPRRWPRVPGLIAAPALVGLCLGSAYVNLSGYVDWITRPETLNARKPAVELADFEIWQEAQMVEARAGRGGFNVAEWMARRAAAQRPAASPAPPGSAAPTAPQASASAPSVPTAAAPAANLPRRGQPLGALGAEAGLVEPRGVAVDASGSVFVADAKAASVVRLGSDGAVQATWAVEPVPNEPAEPWDLVVDGNGEVWVLDSVGALIRRYTRDGRLVASIGRQYGMYRPRGLGIDAAGTLYVADTGAHRVLKILPSGQLAQTIGGGADSFIQQPADIAVGPDGSIFVAEPEAGRVQKLDPRGRPGSAMGTNRTSTIDAHHLAFDPALNLLVISDPPNGRVAFYRPDLTPVGFVDGLKEGPRPLEAPAGVAAHQGWAYVAEARRARIVAYDLGELRP